MDFKVAGTIRGITGIQLDLKIDGINEEIIRATLDQAKDARREILKAIVLALRYPRTETSRHAPRMLRDKINPEKIGLLIGPQGKTIRGIQEATGAKLDIGEDGTVEIAHATADGAEAAKMRVEALCEEVRIGKIYEGRVTGIKDFGCFVECMPGKEGLCHISELADFRVRRTEDVVKMNDMIWVKCLSVDEKGRVRLSRKAAMAEREGKAAPAEAPAESNA
jgi:polyribonucleotide nucleotidyltransferase